MGRESADKGTNAAASPAAAALENYEEHLRCACERGCRLAELDVAELDLQQLRSTCAQLPQLRAPVLELLISHSRLLAQGTLQETGGDADVDEELKQHRERISTLRRRCRELFRARHLR